MDANAALQFLSAITTADTAALLDANLSSFPAAFRQSLEQIRAASLPANLEKTVGRDGTPTYRLKAAADQPDQWMGPTTTPFITADALLSRFDPGTGNVLLPGVGDGSLASAVLAKLRPHQALFVIESEMWRVRAALMLYDLTAAARNGQLVICAGSDAWDQLRQFLLAHRGYLPPERTLALPWIDAAQMRHLQAQMQALQNMSEPATTSTTDSQTTVTRLAILSNSLSATAHYTARGLETAAIADSANTTFCAVPDRPSCLHPHHVQAQLDALDPTHVILVDCLPEDLAVALPAIENLSIVLSHAEVPTGAFLRRVPRHADLWMRSTAQYAAAVEAGFATEQLHRYLPGGARESLTSASSFDRFVVAGPARVPEAAQVGLNMGSHQALWRGCATIIRERCDSYCDEHAAQVFRDAERTLETTIQNEEVRAGLVDRVRQHLGPAVIADVIREQLMNENFEIESAPHDALLQQTPLHPVIWAGTSRTIHPAALRLIAIGVPVVLRRVIDMEAEPGHEAIKVMPGFTQSVELVETIQSWRADAETATSTLAKAREILSSQYSWKHLLKNIFALA